MAEAHTETAGVSAAPGLAASRYTPIGRVYARVGGVMLAILGTVALFAPLITGPDFNVAGAVPYLPPDRVHWLGTNDLGQDIFAQLVQGTRISLGVGVLAALFAVGLGLTAALVGGYLRGSIDMLLMRLVDLVLAFPFVPLVIVLVTFLGSGFLTLVAAISAVFWARPARILRSQVIKVSAFPHVTAARAMGGSALRIMGRHLLPRVAPLAAAQFVRVANVAMLIESSLAFLGLGDLSRPSLGTLMFFANAHNAILTGTWVWWILPEGLTLSCAILGFAFLGLAIEEWADPRLAGATVPSVTAPVCTMPAGAAVSGDTVLQVSDLSVCYQTPHAMIRAVDAISLSVGHGRIVGLIGESGCGKSTLAKAVIGLIGHPGQVTGGSIVINGHDLATLVPPEARRILRREIGFIPQNAMAALDPIRTARQQVAEIAALSGGGAQSVDALLDAVGLAPSQGAAYAHELSGGMRQRVTIAMALASNPSLLIADEPFTGLDVLTQAGILNLLSDLKTQRHLAILLISHDLAVVSRVADETYVIYAGRIVEWGAGRQALGEFSHPYTRALARAFPGLREGRGHMASIAGEPPNMADPPGGCRFHPRCTEAVERCRIQSPELVGTLPNHRAACHLVG